jgi:hypothetical protein
MVVPLIAPLIAPRAVDITFKGSKPVRIMTKKCMPPDHEIANLANKFRELWTPGEDIRTWLRKQSVLMLELVHGDWSWAALAVVLTKAGITYRTGKAWTTDSLRQEATRATAPLKGYARRQKKEAATIVDEQVLAPPQASEALRQEDSQILPEVRPDLVTTDEEPEFKFAKLANWSGNKLAPITRLAPKQGSDPVPDHDVDAIVAKLLGGKSS